MKEVRLIMGMPIEIEIIGESAHTVLEGAFSYFASVDEQFSPYKETSEVSRMNRGEIKAHAESPEMREVLAIGERMKESSGGYFDIRKPDGKIDPSGVVKGWAIQNAAARIRAASFADFFVNAGGDIASFGKDSEGKEWRFGIRNPFKKEEIVKIVYPHGKGLATSGSYERGDHIYNPHEPREKLRDIMSISVIGPDVLEADLMATAAFSMGKDGIAFIERTPGFEGYAIDTNGTATMTSGFAAYTA